MNGATSHSNGQPMVTGVTVNTEPFWFKFLSAIQPGAVD